MDGQDVERIREVYKRWSRGDLTGEIFHPDVEVVWASGMLDTSVDKGIGEFAKTIEQYTDAFYDPRIAAEEIHPGADGTVVLARFSGVGKESGVPTSTPVTHVWEMEGGKAVRVTGHFGHRRELIPQAG